MFSWHFIKGSLLELVASSELPGPRPTLPRSLHNAFLVLFYFAEEIKEESKKLR